VQDAVRCRGAGPTGFALLGTTKVLGGHVAFIERPFAAAALLHRVHEVLQPSPDRGPQPRPPAGRRRLDEPAAGSAARIGRSAALKGRPSRGEGYLVAMTGAGLANASFSVARRALIGNT
jgi:hypothetical protein